MDQDRKQHLESLALGLINSVRAKGGSVSKTRLLKLLYLADVAYYRNKRETYSGFTWVFHLYGPWAPEYDSFLSEMEAKRAITIVPWQHQEGEAQLLQAECQTGLEGVLGNLEAEYEILRQVETLGTKPLGELLNYVYFETEPMEGALRGSKLDFSTVGSSGRFRPYKKTSSAELNRKAMVSLRQKLTARKPESGEAFTPPRFDQEYFEMMKEFDAEE